MATMNSPPQVAGNAQRNSDEPSPILEPLRYRTRKSLYLLSFYVAILLAPWIMTCVMMVRPLDAASYTRQGLGQSAAVVLDILVSFEFILVLEKLQAVLAIPIVSGFLAQAAVVYTQRRSPNQKLSLRQIVALADRPWANVKSWFRSLPLDGHGSPFAIFGGLFVLLVAVTPAIQSILIKYEDITIATCWEMPVWTCDPSNIATIVGLDPEPAALESMPQSLAVQQVAKKTQLVGELDVQPYLWPEQWTTIDDAEAIERGTFFWYDESFRSDRYFVSALQNGTNTGVLRQHAIRLNSTSACETVHSSEFPQTCSGDRPFVTNLTAPDTLDIRICAPGTFGQTPWTRSRDRQDISEELWIDVVQQITDFSASAEQSNFTLKCTTNTTRGYFEISNYKNGNNPGPLLEKWPSQEVLKHDFNDYLGVDDDYAIPSVVDNDTTTLSPSNLPDPFNYEDLYAAGPLMTSALALFGNQSFLNAASYAITTNTTRSALFSICQFNALPFTRLSLTSFSTAGDTCEDLLWDIDRSSDDYWYQYLMNTIYIWIASFNDTQSAATALDMATYFANEAVLTSTATQDWSYNSRSIYFDSGTVLVKPKWSLAGVIVISVLIGLQILCLCLIVFYCHSVPTWTDSLDAFAMLRMGAEVQREKHVRFAGIRDTDKRDWEDLGRFDGLVGVVLDGSGMMQGGGDGEHSSMKDSSPLVRRAEGGPSTSSEIELAELPPYSSTVSVDAHNGEGSGEGDERVRKEGLEPPFRLAVGAPGLITKSMAPKRKARGQRKTRGQRNPRGRENPNLVITGQTQV
ncbi:uncharacterized protein BO87DRAFT_361993 [Aspergillus neoniger CBS 115656]|uniref:Uncharacterized protein n=1 Tax=Aspergillus neoniger (strain CBS 115656) TaxID=1448310 RepID=A0A318YJP2_ASPNB|nr:hypothetical protein BO87DRAFT_361993 [Aspergillus neoniger CBS 115656]PYH32803.1 hypothetical protein BO87DRAFT_361993 [Aspergillus neoniger CBS 115656]